MPLISVIIPAFNAEAFLLDSIQSIIDQSYQNLEIIVVEDGSTDSTLDLLESINDTRISILKNHENKGVAYSLNKGLDFATGKYIVRHDADDISYRYRIEKLYVFLESHPETQVVSSGYYRIDSGMKTYSIKKDAELLTLIDCPVHHPGTMYRRGFIKNNNCKYYGLAEDYFFWNEIYKSNSYKKGTFYNIDEPLFEYRMHQDQLTQTSKNKLNDEKIESFPSFVNDFLFFHQIDISITTPGDSKIINTLNTYLKDWVIPGQYTDREKEIFRIKIVKLLYNHHLKKKAFT